MKFYQYLILMYLAVIFSVAISACGVDRPPDPGQVITLEEHGVVLTLADGWEAEVKGDDWATWARVKKKWADEQWVIPPITARNISFGEQEGRTMNWRFKGVTGEFNPSVEPESSGRTEPAGLWELDPEALDMDHQYTKTLEWPGLEGVEATVRLYENTHGFGGSSDIWHTQTVAFTHGVNTYEFVMSIPSAFDTQDWTDEFWNSIEDLEIEE